MERTVKREVLERGVIKLSAGECTFTFEQPRPGLLLVTIIGHDRGELGSSTVDEILLAIGRGGPLELFVDASRATGVAVTVSDEWTRFFATNRDRLKRVHILVTSEFVHLPISIAQHLSRTGDLIKIHTDTQRFGQLLHDAVQRKLREG